MPDRMCVHQQEAIDAASAGREPGAALAQHVSQCASCREAIAVIRWMQQMAQEPVPAHPMPNPDVIWWKAQLLRRWEVERKAAAPIEHMHKAEILAGLVGLVTFVVWQWSGLTRAMSNVIPALAEAPPSLGLVLGSLFIGGMILAGVHRLLAD